MVHAAAGEVTEDAVLDEIVASAAREVAVLPNDAALVPIAGRAAARARDAGRDVGVVPTRSPVQGLAAVAVTDPGRRFADDVIAMAEAAAATRWAEVTVAEQEALTTAGRCEPGDVLGSAEGDVVVIGSDLAASPATCSTGCSRPAARWRPWWWGPTRPSATRSPGICRWCTPPSR